MKLLYSLLLMLSVCILLRAMAEELATFGTWVDEKGVISLPQDYRSHWAHLGSWLNADTSAPGHGFHDGYVQPEAVAYFQRSGQFPDSARAATIAERVLIDNTVSSDVQRFQTSS